MGICCCCGNRPPKEYTGTWTNGNTVLLRIWPSGSMHYVREFDGGREAWRTSACYDEKGFWTFICCCSLSGTYVNQTRKGPAFIVKNDVLTKQPVPISAISAQTTI